MTISVRQVNLASSATEPASPEALRKALRDRAAAVAAVAAAHADEVDREGRFPAEAVAAAKQQRLLGLLVPRELGGEGASIHDLMEVCFTLGRACASTAMIVAMHTVKVACVVRHGRGQPAMDSFLRRVAAEQMLLASSTTEGQNGGNIRASAAAVETEGDRIRLDRSATVISYGAQADGLVTIARRAPDAAASDQVLLALPREDYTLEAMQGWDTLGMRGTCSTGFELKVRASAERVFPQPYDRIHAQTMTPWAHLCWGSAWAGIAAAATDKAHRFLRKAARASGGQLPPGAPHFTRAKAALASIQAQLASAADRYDAAADDEAALAALDLQTSLTMLKVEVSEQALSAVLSAMRACGLSGYRNDGEASVGRHLRDVLSAPLMINNDRILANVATASLMSGVPDRLRP